MYPFLNIFFFVFHTSLILFVMFGWIWRPLRIPHLIAIASISVCWFVIGIWYGWGYCPCTDWHWRVRQHMGLYDMPASYTKFLFDRFTGLTANAALVDAATVILYFLAAGASLHANRNAIRRMLSAAKKSSPAAP